jgi:hypothetical protein
MLMSVAPPATIAMPSVWENRNIGNAHSDPDSRTHALKERVSSHSKNAIISAAPLGIVTLGVAVHQIPQEHGHERHAQHD